MNPAADNKPSRLRFIDMGRAVAILLMLEGHFVSLTLGEPYRIEDNKLYSLWLYCRGLAAPMFFTVTGLIFSFLLCGTSSNEPYFKTKRVRRGLIRVMELLFWGYALQFPPALPTGKINLHVDSWAAFHVLQCIACALISMIAIFGLFRRFGTKVLFPAFILCGFSMFLLDQILHNIEGYWPAGFPAVIQNVVRGPNSHFSIAPWLGFTFYGAAIGTWVRHHQQRKGGVIHPAPLLIIGYILSKFGWSADGSIAHAFLECFGIDKATREVTYYFHARFGEALLIIGLLVCFDKWVKWNTTWFEKIGRSTFSIYVLHVVILYGAILGVGINSAWIRALTPWQAALGALMFMIAFGLMAQVAQPIKNRWHSLWQRMCKLRAGT